MKKIKRSVWLPTLLLCYLAALTIYFGPRLIANHETIRLILVSSFELIIIFILAILLRRKEQFNKTNDDDNN